MQLFGDEISRFLYRQASLLCKASFQFLAVKQVSGIFDPSLRAPPCA